MGRRRAKNRAAKLLAAAAAAGTLMLACSTSPPKNISDSCEIFEEKDDWYEAAHDSYERWGVPIQVQLAIIYQESRFVHDAKPPRKKLLWVIPWTRLSSAYGYGQIQDSTWDWYRKSTGRRWADRDDFDDVADFIGWYGDVSHRKLGISKWDAHNQYLAYHEGHGGFKRKTYEKKPWLIKVAKKVDARAREYGAQLKACEDSLGKGWWFF
ncbi:MAG: transglycosylase SLT domain-containing protein [Thiogranum sp.]